MSARSLSRRPIAILARTLLAAAALGAVAPLALAGTWTKLIHNPPAGVNLMLLLPDGTVMASKQSGPIGKGWFRLTPDSTGSYVNGTWTTLAPMIDTRLYYSSQVLRDGRVFIAGGEYGTGGPNAEVYDPKTNVWTQVNPPAALWNPAVNDFVDSPSEMLPDGRVLIMPVFPHTSGVGLIYDPVANTWSNAGPLKHGSNQSEAAWAKLPDNSILTIDPFGTLSERYIPATNTWINDNPVPIALYDPVAGEIGGALLLPNGLAFFLGSTGHTALYAPTGTTTKGTWTAGPDIPAGQGTPDAPAAMLVTGHVLCAVSPIPTPANPYAPPTTFYEYDPVANAFSSVGAPVGSSDNTPCYTTAMLDLPDGNVLYSHFATSVYVYSPGGAPLAAGKPTVTSITANADGTWHLIGTGLNGISAGATYGDDLQMNSNYPLVRLTSGATVRYARSFNWSSTGVMTGATPVSTEFSTLGVPDGDYSLQVVANGIASDAVPFTQSGLGTWTSVGDGKDGLLGIPELTGTGTQIAGQPVALQLVNGNFSATAALFIGLANNPTPFKGGLLVPVPAQFQLMLATDSNGEIALPFLWPAGLPAGFSLYYQYAIQDFFATNGVSLSNALRSTTP